MDREMILRPKADNALSRSLRKMGGWLLLLLLGLGLLACEPPSLDYVVKATVRPSKVDLVGVWRPRSGDLAYMKYSGNYNIQHCQFVLNADESAEGVELPDWLFQSGSGGKVVSGIG